METNDQKQFEIDGSMVSLDELIKGYSEAKTQEDTENKTLAKRKNEQALKPYQAELIKLQNHLEDTNQKMIILFEGRDAAGKGGTIRRITRYMNEKHYRIVALGSLFSDFVRKKSMMIS
jgi:polyphosphate kinase 2 (PPK2 family)